MPTTQTHTDTHMGTNTNAQTHSFELRDAVIPFSSLDSLGLHVSGPDTNKDYQRPQVTLSRSLAPTLTLILLSHSVTLRVTLSL